MHADACVHLCTCFGAGSLVPHSGVLIQCGYRPGTFSSIALQIQPVLGSVIAINCMASISFGKVEESKRTGQSRISLAIMADCFHSQ